MTYNLSFLDNTSSMGDIIVGIDVQSGGVFSIGLFLTIAVLLFFMFRERDMVEVLMGVSFFMTAIGGAMLAMGLLDVYWVGAALTTLVVSTFIYVFRSG